jgi:hypothetical protein
MMRLAAAVLVAVLVAFPVSVMPAPPVTWLAVVALAVGGAGVVALSVPLVTAGAALALVAYALALVIARPEADSAAAIVFSALLVVLLALVHFAGRVEGAALGPAVVVSQLRQWLVVVTLGVVAAAVLAAGAAALGPVLAGAGLPLVVVAVALGALLAAAGVVALVQYRDAGPPDS